MAGRWIVFEGLDGAGTTTQTRLLVEYLQSLFGEEQVFATAEPTHGVLGELCRAALRGTVPLDRQTLALTFNADRSDHLQREGGLLAHRTQGHWIVQDRYLYSTLAYQDGIDNQWLRGLSLPFPRPDLLVFLETPWRVCLERIGRRGKMQELFEREDELRRVAHNYQSVLEHDLLGEALLCLPGEAPPEVLHQRVLDRLKEWLPPR